MDSVFDAYAAYYDLLYEDKDYAAEVEYIQGLLEKFDITSGSILEFGCGTGKHAELLAANGFNVCGVDLSEKMIEAANLRTGNSESCSEKLEFIAGDVRNVSLNRQFDMAISLFHVASYQTTNDDILSMLKNAGKHLSEGGVFIFDFWYGPGVLTERPSIKVKRFSSAKCGIVRIAEPDIRYDENVVDVNFSVLVTNKIDNTVSKIYEKHSMRYFFLPEIDLLLSKSGFKIEIALEWMQDDIFGKDTWQSVIVARKVSNATLD